MLLRWDGSKTPPVQAMEDAQTTKACCTAAFMYVHVRYVSDASHTCPISSRMSHPDMDSAGKVQVAARYST
jgi:hypothetical protein